MRIGSEVLCLTYARVGLRGSCKDLAHTRFDVDALFYSKEYTKERTETGLKDVKGYSRLRKGMA